MMSILSSERVLLEKIRFSWRIFKRKNPPVENKITIIVSPIEKS
jgi:hypothetical protein